MGEDSSNILEIASRCLHDYGYLAIFILLFLEATIFMGAFVPGVIVLVLAGYASNADYLSPPLVLSTALSGVIAGDNASFFWSLLWKTLHKFSRTHSSCFKEK